MTGGQQGDVAWLAVEFRAVVHANSQDARDVILKMRRFTALGFGDWLNGCRPAPARLKDGTPNGRPANFDQLQFSFRKFTDFVRLPEVLQLGFLPDSPFALLWPGLSASVIRRRVSPRINQVLQDLVHELVDRSISHRRRLKNFPRALNVGSWH